MKTNKLEINEITGLRELLREKGLLLPPGKRDKDNARGLILLIKGRPGTGKSTLALQLLRESLNFPQDESVSELQSSKHKFYSFEQGKEDIVNKYKTLDNAIKNKYRKESGEDEENSSNPEEKINKSVDINMFREAYFNAEKGFESGISPLINLRKVIENLKSDDKNVYPLLVLDGLNVLTEEEIKNINIHQIFHTLRRKSLVTIIVFEPNQQIESYLEYLADMVIELKATTVKDPIQYNLNYLCISKARYQDAVLGWHQYKIREYGLEIYCSIHFLVHKPNYMLELTRDKKSIYDKNAEEKDKEAKIDKIKGDSIIEQCLNGIYQDSFTVILGPRATFKSTLSIDFLTAGIKLGDKSQSLLVSLIDTKDAILQSIKKCPHKFEGCKDEEKRCYKNIMHFHQQPGGITTSEFFHFLNDYINDTRINRIAFWDLTQLEYRFPFLASDPMFLPGLMDYLKRKRIASIVMGSGNSKFSKAAAAMSDNVIFNWRDTILTNEDKKGEKEEEKLILYVDRCQGNLGDEGKGLFALPINNNTLQLPECKGTTGNRDISKYNIVKKNLTDDSKDIIKRIENLQGFGV